MNDSISDSEHQMRVQTVRRKLAEDIDKVLGNLTVPKLSTYDYLQNHLLLTNVTSDIYYQTKFKGFYGAGPMADDRWQQFFSILESEKSNKAISFSQVLERNHTEHGSVEASFSSKIVATINPEMPVWDSKVLEDLDLKAPYQSMETGRRMREIVYLYSRIQELVTEIIRSNEFENWRRGFDGAFPQFVHFTDVKKLDLFLWQYDSNKSDAVRVELREPQAKVEGEMTFWGSVYKLREQELIPLVWKRSHIRPYLERPNGRFASNAINTIPSNQSMTMDGQELGNYIKKGQTPKAWRVGSYRSGEFQLICDPNDDIANQEAKLASANELLRVVVSSLN